MHYATFEKRFYNYSRLHLPRHRGVLAMSARLVLSSLALVALVGCAPLRLTGAVRNAWRAGYAAALIDVRDDLGRKDAAACTEYAIRHGRCFWSGWLPACMVPTHPTAADKRAMKDICNLLNPLVVVPEPPDSIPHVEETP